MSFSSSVGEYLFKSYDGVLKPGFIEQSVPQNCHPQIERVKEEARKFAIKIFESLEFEKIFPGKRYGEGFSKGLSYILGELYVLCSIKKETGNENFEELVEFDAKVKMVAQNVLLRFKAIANKPEILPHEKLSDVREAAKEINDYKGICRTVPLSKEILKQMAPEGFLKCKVAWGSTGHLVAKLASDNSQEDNTLDLLWQNLFDAFKDEIIEKCLTVEGQEQLGLPYNIGSVVIASKEQLKNVSKEAIESLMGQEVKVFFGEDVYGVISGDDGRYYMVVCGFLKSADIDHIRVEKLGVAKKDATYPDGKPLRLTFAAVKSKLVDWDKEKLMEEIKKCDDCLELIEWHHLIEVFSQESNK